MEIISLTIERFSCHFKLFKNEVQKYIVKSQADVLNILIYIWILLSAVVTCSVYFWKNNDLGFIKVTHANDRDKIIPDWPKPVVAPTPPKKLKIKSTTVKMHRLNKVSEECIKENIGSEKIVKEPSKPASGKLLDTKCWINEIIRLIFTNPHNKQRISSRIMTILNEILENSASQTSERNISVVSISFGSRCPEINYDSSKIDETLSLFSWLLTLVIPQLVIEVSMKDIVKESNFNGKCVIYISEFLMKIDIESYLSDQGLKMKINFIDKVITHSHIDAPNMDSITCQSIKQDIISAFDKSVIELEFRLGDTVNLMKDEFQVSHQNNDNVKETASNVADKSTSPKTVLYLNRSLVFEERHDPIIQNETMPLSLEKNESRPEKLLTIHYAMIPFLINERFDEILLCIQIDNPKQNFKCQVSSFKKTETGIENIFACINATFFIGQPSAVLKFIVQTDNGQILRSGQIHVTEQLQETISFLSMTLHLPIERENDFIFSTNMEFATISVIFSSICLNKTNTRNILHDCQRSENQRASYRQLDNIEDGVIREISEYSDKEDEYGEDMINLMNIEGLAFEQKEIKVMTSRENLSHNGENSKHHKKLDWYKRLPAKAFQKCKTKIYGKIRMEKRTLFSTWNHPQHSRNCGKVHESEKSVSINSILKTGKFQTPHPLYSSAPDIGKDFDDLEPKSELNGIE